MSLKIVKGFIKLNYLPRNVSLSRKNLKNLISIGMSTAGCNILIDNVPEYSAPQDSQVAEKVTTDHIFETLAQFGSPQGFVIQVTRNCYIGYATDADEIATIFTGKNIDGHELRVEYHELAKPLVISPKAEANVSVIPSVFEALVVLFFFGAIIYIYAMLGATNSIN
jgi:hypothetical protein